MKSHLTTRCPVHVSNPGLVLLETDALRPELPGGPDRYVIVVTGGLGGEYSAGPGSSGILKRAEILTLVNPFMFGNP